MTFKLENKLPHVNQLLNVFFAVILFDILSDIGLKVVNLTYYQLAVSCVLSFFVVFAWWRQNDIYLSTTFRNFNYIIYAVLRIVPVIILVNLKDTLVSGNESVLLTFVISSAFLCIVSIWQFSILLKPTYGKVRVFLKREIWTDALILLAVGILFLPTVLNLGIISVGNSFVIFLAVLFLVRIIARMLTPWKDPAPPHRGGKSRSDYTRSGTRSTHTRRPSANRPGGSDSSTRRPPRPGNRPESSTDRPKRPTRDSESSTPRAKRPIQESAPKPRRKPAPRPKQSRTPASTGTRTAAPQEKKIEKTAPSPVVEKTPRKSPAKKSVKPAVAVDEVVASDVQQVKETKKPVKREVIKKDKPEVVQEPEVRVDDFGKRNVKKKRPQFTEEHSGNESETLQNKPAEPAGENQLVFGRTPKKKTR
ncbi:MAG: hypothetical protein DWQ05_20505 [Calditrichaeota bacterium]|nr:MAG: hypothetical protein DWQ05_20505 [Calditrichota bacterium]